MMTVPLAPPLAVCMTLERRAWERWSASTPRREAQIAREEEVEGETQQPPGKK